MFIKFKKIALMFVLCMGIFGTTAFADVIAPNGVSYKNYCSYYYSGVQRFCYSDSEFYYEGSLLRCYGTWYKFVGSALQSTNNSGVGIVSNTNSDYTDIIYENGVETVPPQVAPTVPEAIQKIVPDLSNQLKILLPVGVIALSIMLGVSLVPRLVRLFL